ncbi:MAG: hypothetical protein HC853_01930 [Anaerolineae bacterium]|nr:hypothetical protein [Anaerolineae bacterium]
MKDLRDTPKTVANKPSARNASAPFAADSLLSALGMMLNELGKAGLVAVASNDDEARSLVITIKGAEAEALDGKARFKTRAFIKANTPEHMQP